MAESTRSKDLHDSLKRQEVMLLEERSLRQNTEQHLNSKFESLVASQTDLQTAVLHIQTQLQSIADQMQIYNKNKSVLGEGLASPPEKGKAELWFQSFMEGKDSISWSRFLLALLERFDDIDPELMIGEFNKLQQASSVSQYIEKFEELKSYMLIFNKDFLEEYFTASFISGLREDIKAPTFPSKPPFVPQRKLLTASEMKARREKNLCYNCDEVFVPSHKCKQRQIYMIMSHEEEEAYSADVEPPNTSPEELLSEDMTISINAISGNSDLNTLRIKGLVKNSSIQILIDSGSTHCFLDENVAINLGCHVEFTNPMLISVADGNKIVSRTFCPDFTWEIQGTKFTYPMRIIKLGGCDVVLGGGWLRQHSPVEFDYHKMKLTICKNGKRLIMKAITESAELHLLSDGFNWSDEATLAFNALKTAMTTTPVLALPNFSFPFIVETDASSKGIDAVLMQQGDSFHETIIQFRKYLSSGIIPHQSRLHGKITRTWEQHFQALILVDKDLKNGGVMSSNDVVLSKEGKNMKLTRVYENDAASTEELKESDGYDINKTDAQDHTNIQQTWEDAEFHESVQNSPHSRDPTSP
ncbi:hypothetical protein BUALT_Bualt15G0118400 [Buddleja alternifolia]|uniref:Retrotransposon gag domain-containing protein n=1 Tax=Buddleja alternifolia TaxID=168488 RepID=A0AAV6WNI3_9LAMI|nr:hypothetical protein BUALT_Bualt15G0118400 [Buddleja alternifolia]